MRAILSDKFAQLVVVVFCDILTHMSKRFSACVSFLALAWVLGPIASTCFSQDEIQWLDNYKDAIREARQARKPIFLEFRCEA